MVLADEWVCLGVERAKSGGVLVFDERVYLGTERSKKLDEESLSHHGIKGQQWGVRQGPPYPLSRPTHDISAKSYARLNDIYKSMPYEDRILIDPDTSYDPQDYFSSLAKYKQVTAYNAISDNGFLVAEKIPKNLNVDGTKGVEIGIGVKTKGHGIGTSMVSDLVDWFDNQDEYDTMWWPVDERNKASIRVAEKNGFIKDPLGDNYIYAKDSAYKKLGIDNHLEHHGILGMKWGVRRYQNPDGTLTPDGRKRYAERNLKNAKLKNFDSWGKDKDHNVLYIIGASGTGKSTTAMGLTKHNDSVIHLDTLFENEEHGSVKRNREFEAFCTDKGIDISRARDMRLSKRERWDVIDQIADQIEPYGQQCYDSGKKVVVEGVQMADDTMFPDKRYFKDKSVITLHSGKLSSAFRASTRDKKNVIDIFKDMTDRERSEWYDYVEENLKKIDRL